MSDVDRAARLRAQTCFDRPVALVAGAGTGKTAALVARVVGWSVGLGWERHASDGAAPEAVAAAVLRRIVAITFTEAAAAEMAERVARGLRELADGEQPPGLEPEALSAGADTSRARAALLLGALDQLQVRTIHAFCRRLLAEHPLPIGLHPRFSVDADESLHKALVREVLEAALPDLLERSEPMRLLAARGRGPQRVEEALLHLLREGVPRGGLGADPLADLRVQALLDDLRESLDSVLAVEAGRLASIGTRARKVSETAEKLAQLRDRVAATPASRAGLMALCEGFAALDLDLGRVRQWSRGKGLGTRADEALAEDRPALVAAAARLHPRLDHLKHLDPELLDAAHAVLAPLLDQTWDRLRSRGVESFPALLRDASDLLTSRPGVAARARAGIDQLLVDEFQDTDRVQCAILRRLALEGDPGARPGLFLVGDPKQSIYGWRNADLAAYDGFLASVEEAGGEVLQLRVNRRSRPAILKEVTRIVAPVMHAESGLQPEYTPLAPSRDAGDPMSRVEHWISWGWDAEAGTPAKTTSANAHTLEARAVAADLQRLAGEGVAWSRVGLLFRSGTDYETVLSELRRAGIPFAVEGDRNYFERREVIEAAALVRCVLDPNDQLALLTLLRSSVVGVPDAALIPLWGADLPRCMAALPGPTPGALAAVHAAVDEACKQTPDDIPGIERVEGWRENLLGAARGLDHLRRSFDRDPADVFVERLRSLFLFEVCEAARYLGPYRVANLDRFFLDLLEALRHGEGDPQAILRALRQDVAERRAAEEGRPREALADAVQVMTIHKAKGLDFDHVYLLQLDKGPPPGREAARAEEVEPGRFEYEVLGQPERRQAGVPSLGYEEIRARAAAVEEAERVRTLYVALTRARERLVVSRCGPEFARRPSGESHAALLEQRSERPDLPEWMGRLARAGEWREEDADGVVWAFPAFAPRAEAAEDRRPADAPGGVDAISVARSLAANRRRALDLGEKPFHAPVSDAAHENALERVREAGADDDAVAPRLPRDAALAVGTAVHRALEHLDVLAEPDAERTRATEALKGELVRALPPPARDEAIARADALLDRFFEGPLLAKLRALGPHIAARELPVLLKPDPDDSAAPVGFQAGVVDLLYRDPETDAWVVADYKTDLIESDADLDERCVRYAAQGEGYVTALQDALGLEVRPRFELWFLDRDVIV